MSFNKFIRKYKEMYPLEGETINKYTYGRRKMKVAKSMTKIDLIKASHNHPQIGVKISSGMMKQEILQVLKRYSGFW